MTPTAPLIDSAFLHKLERVSRYFRSPWISQSCFRIVEKVGATPAHSRAS